MVDERVTWDSVFSRTRWEESEISARTAGGDDSGDDSGDDASDGGFSG